MAAEGWGEKEICTKGAVDGKKNKQRGRGGGLKSSGRRY